MDEVKKYSERTIKYEVEKKIKTLNKTRNNRLEMSKRLSDYDDKWKVVFFILNIEAVIFILLALSNIQINELFAETSFSLFSGIFSIYVILLQYYINSLNYRERALRLHYHQLDIEDLILRLKRIFLIQNDSNQSFKDSQAIEEYKIIMFEYQAFLKNNENHNSLDNKVSEFNKSDSDKWKFLKRAKIIDFTVDKLILCFNILFAFALLIFLLRVLWVVS